ncbi:GH36-type glycosyl hydrolase domain-containing protein, partial [Singulisphaera rosea]
AAAAALERLEERFHEQGAEVDDIVRREHRRQAAKQIWIGNCVISLRLLSAMDWNAAFERINLVEVVLRDDPAGIYTLQDFATRDRYRRAVETIARRAGADESEVALRAVELARANLDEGTARSHVGYYLVDHGLTELKQSFPPAGIRLKEALSRWSLGHPWAVYSGSILLLFATIVTLLALPTAVGPWSLALVVLALLLPASELAVGIVNHVLTLVMPARVLPKLEFKEGIPADCPTFVVMPSMLIRPQSAESLLERLEIHYLANPDPRLRFALLTDFADADEEHTDADEGYIRDALARLRVLNQKYAPTGPDLFFLFHRRRIWNPIQGCWMGWERKRGKLSEFNRLIRGDRETSYHVLSVEDPADIPKVRFVITLDSDTQMPRDSARRLVGTLAHPLNLPRFDPALG